MARAKTEKLELVESIDKEKIKKELTLYIDEKMEKDFPNYVDNRIRKEFREELEKSNRRLIKEKNRKIFYRNIIILILLMVIGCLLYVLYDNNYFSRFLVKESKTNSEVVNKETEPEKEEIVVKEPTLEELISEYGYLLDNIYIDQNSDYKEDYYNGNLTTELKNYLALNLVDIKDLTIEDDYNMLDDNILKDAYLKIFNDNYQSKSFKYNGIDLRYISKMESYITDKLITKAENKIERKITDIKVNNQEINITATENNTQLTYLFKDNKLVSISK